VRDWQNTLKYMIHHKKTENKRKIIHANSIQKGAGAALLQSDKTYFQSQVMRERRILNIDKSFNLSRMYKRYKYICTLNRVPKERKQTLTQAKGAVVG